MKERPILFNGEMVRAILDGRKTQTRRGLKPQPLQVRNDGPPEYDWVGSNDGFQDEFDLTCPYGKPGDRLWVRETWADMTACYSEPLDGESPLNVAFKADNSVWNVYGKAVYLEQLGQAGLYVDKWKPSIHMHRQSSRITLEITNVCVERLQDISEKDAESEGVQLPVSSDGKPLLNLSAKFKALDYADRTQAYTYRAHYAALWDSISGKKHPWESNPWVWVVEFKTVEK